MALRSDWRDGIDEPTAVPALLDAFRAGDADVCVDTVIGALGDGLSPRTIWTALDIVAVELSVRWQHGSWGVHELDANNGFRYLQQLTPDGDTELLALLQSAAWRSLFRSHVDDIAPRFDEGLDALEPAAGAAPTLIEAFASLEGDRVTAARVMKSHFAGGGTPEAVIEAWPDIVVKHASRDAHHYKFHAALLEETEAALPEWRETLLLGITMRGPSPSDPTWTRHDEAETIIAELAERSSGLNARAHGSATRCLRRRLTQLLRHGLQDARARARDHALLARARALHFPQCGEQAWCRSGVAQAAAQGGWLDGSDREVRIRQTRVT